ncbi:uncharacterized protein LOC134196540 isoform X2 [Corticium candelabrum]|nr:uncharacterized protein LOC134196540 isoform X2 [Corticium candelabrum]
MAQCAQLEGILRSKERQRAKTEISASARMHQTSRDSAVNAILERMKDFLRQLPVPETDAYGYLEYTGLAELYPRGSAVVDAFDRNEQNDDDEMEGITALTDAYFPQVAMLHDLVVMCNQLDHDILHLSNHKYIAHQTALLFQCVNQAGQVLAQEKTAIEQNFKAIKSACAVQEGSTAPPQLPSHLKQWLLKLTESVRTKVTRLPFPLAVPLKPVIDFISVHTQDS